MYSQLAKEFGGKCLALQVCQSAAGFYLGTLDEDGAPNSRDSLEYWSTQEMASQALRAGNWTQRDTP